MTAELVDRVSRLDGMVRGGRAPLEVRDGHAMLFGHRMFGGSTSGLMDELDGLVKAGGPRLVVTANVDQALNLRHDADLRAAYEVADLRLIDGQPIAAAFRALGAVGAARNTGADLIDHVIDAADERGWRIAVFGGAPGVAQIAVNRLSNRMSPGYIQAFEFPFVTSVDAAAASPVVDRLRDFQPNIVFMCLGSPKQEQWYMSWKDRLPSAIYVGAGAAVDFAAGRRHRAPGAVQRMGLEWVWRLVQEPRRLAGRYLLKGPKFLPLLVASAIRAR